MRRENENGLCGTGEDGGDTKLVSGKENMKKHVLVMPRGGADVEASGRIPDEDKDKVTRLVGPKISGGVCASVHPKAWDSVKDEPRLGAMERGGKLGTEVT